MTDAGNGYTGLLTLYSFPEKLCTTSSSAKMGQNFSGDLYL